MRWTVVLSVLLFSLELSGGVPVFAAQVKLAGVHAELACAACHSSGSERLARPSSLATRAAGCTGCHQGYGQIFDQAMTVRGAEKHFANTAFHGLDDNFFANNCTSCHVSDCLDCHGGDGHKIGAATQQQCLSCHKGYFVGPEYLGKAPREDHPRYQRGPELLGEHYLKMRPDLHAEAGLQCQDCHTMASLIAGHKSAQSCRDCHQPDPQVIEHGIAAHLEKLECYACHSAWAAQEYGTFYLRIGKDNEDKIEQFHVVEPLTGDYLTRVYLRKQDAPPLGLNARGRVSPIRPEFIAYYSDLREDSSGVENRLLSAQWKAFFPHTVRRGSVMCDSCHDDRRRYLLEPEDDRLYRIDLDGMTLPSFWNQQGQQVSNGAFISPQQFSELNKKDGPYTRAYVKRWQELLGRGADSSPQ